MVPEGSVFSTIPHAKTTAMLQSLNFDKKNDVSGVKSPIFR